MSLSSFSTATTTILRKIAAPSPPEWVAHLLGHDPPDCGASSEEFSIQMSTSGSFAWIAVRINDAASLDAVKLRESTRKCYGEIFRTLSMGSPATPVRFWNFLPRIHDLIDDKQSRYMVFNAGRFLAFEDHYGDSRLFDRSVATASAVGHHGRDLWIHCLATTERAINLGNPRQVSPHRYSSRFGRLPPCFARATLLPARSLLLIAGTASICGEESLHDDLEAQLHETLANLGAVIEIGEAQQEQVRTFPPNKKSNDKPLSQLTDIRIYHPRSADLRPLGNLLRQRLGDRPRLEFLHADLCRSELLVEIEAIADLSINESSANDGVHTGVLQ